MPKHPSLFPHFLLPVLSSPSKPSVTYHHLRQVHLLPNNEQEKGQQKNAKARKSILDRKKIFPVEDGVDEAKSREGLIAWREGLLVGWMLDGGAVVGLGIFGAKLGGLVLFEFWTGEGRVWIGIDGGVGGR